jgi:predicted metal-dependent hydrolase
VATISREALLRAGAELFNSARYLAAHEVFEELWESTEGGEADFYKGLIQAAIALHHFQSGNLAGAAALAGSHRRLLAAYLPAHAGLDVQEFLDQMQACLRPVQRRDPGAPVSFAAERRPRLVFQPAPPES